MSIRLVLADDHPIVLKGLSHLFGEESGFDVLAECTDAETALRTVRRHKPDVLILDLRIPTQADGLRVLRELQEEDSPTAVVVHTGRVTDDEAVDTMRLGARGIFLKEMSPELLIRCVRKVAGGGQWFEKTSVGRILDRVLMQRSAEHQLSSQLTPREREAFDLVVAGLSNAQIAERLFVTEGTVKTHLHAIYDKLRVRGRVQLMLFAREQKLV